MSTDDARKALHQWLDDLNALRPFIQADNPDFVDFTAAWSAALERAKIAARDYATALHRSGS